MKNKAVVSVLLLKACPLNVRKSRPIQTLTVNQSTTAVGSSCMLGL